VLKKSYIIIEGSGLKNFNNFIKFNIMASKHQLSLDIPETSSCNLFRVIDSSIYSDLLDVTCLSLLIKVPGFNEYTSITVVPAFNLTLNACSLGIQTSDCGTTSLKLPDGIYNVKYSVSPNDKVFVEYNYLRVCQILSRYYDQLCKLEMAACEPPADVKADLDELRLIKSFIDAAKVKVEVCNSPDEGMDLLNYAQKRLDKFTGNCHSC
jgi:hypothetical protein